jgi:tetratricopeptide (TPR) repeat protein
MTRLSSAYSLLKMIVLLTFVLTFGCMSSKNEWKSVEGPTETGNTSALIAKANRQTGEADSKEKILELIHNYESVLRIDPADYEALWSLGSYYSLVGMAYPDNMYEKESYYKKAMQCCERAMYTNPDFRGLIAQGEEPWRLAALYQKGK